MDTRHCNKCDEHKPLSEFYKNKTQPSGYAGTCKSCHKKENLAYRHRHPERVYKKELAGKETIKVEVFTHYCGGAPKCNRCGLDDIRALTIDHINGDGWKDRSASRRGGIQFYRWLKSYGYPTNVQVLCMSCQWIKRYENCEMNHQNRQ